MYFKITNLWSTVSLSFATIYTSCKWTIPFNYLIACFIFNCLRSVAVWINRFEFIRNRSTSEQFKYEDPGNGLYTTCIDSLYIIRVRYIICTYTSRYRVRGIWSQCFIKTTKATRFPRSTFTTISLPKQSRCSQFGLDGSPGTHQVVSNRVDSSNYMHIDEGIMLWQ